MGWSPKEKRLGWWRPREVSGPTRLSHSRGSCHSAAKVSASRTYFITRRRGEGLGNGENAAPRAAFWILFAGRRGRRPLQGGCDDGGARYTGVRAGGWNPAPTRYAHGSAHGASRRNPVGVGVLDDPNVGLPRGKIQRRYVKTRRTRDAEAAGVARFIFSRLPLCCREPNIRARSALPAGSGADRGRARFAISSRSWPASFRFLSSSNASWQCPQSR